MKPLGTLNQKELQKIIDDSLFSEIAWLPSQIMYREELRKFLKVEIEAYLSWGGG